MPEAAPSKEQMCHLHVTWCQSSSSGVLFIHRHIAWKWELSPTSENVSKSSGWCSYFLLTQKLWLNHPVLPTPSHNKNFAESLALFYNFPLAHGCTGKTLTCQYTDFSFTMPELIQRGCARKQRGEKETCSYFRHHTKARPSPGQGGPPSSPLCERCIWGGLKIPNCCS